ncbi:SDR family NAD(P)-dependent oxidoreductase [Larkinella insperata]|uniref:SDR family NAD(P)-dependent oxidoreductase n=1 Tax=Larkinella insperata TaxID=332158 RepID=A0ABW3QH15_9BACT
MRKKVIVLGASSGIGKATVERFAREGWQVLMTGIEPNQTQAVLQGLPGEGHQARVLDVSSQAEVQQFGQYAEQHLGPFDALINCIGISQSVPVVGSDFNDWNKPLEIMLYGYVHACRSLIPLLKDGGRIVHITSIHHDRVAYGSSAYGMAKAAVTQLTRALAVELAPRNILANAIAPGFVNTPMSIKADGRNELETDWFRDNYITYDHLPLKRAGKPEEIAGVAWFLAGPDASYMTGSVLTVDGGLLITF